MLKRPIWPENVLVSQALADGKSQLYFIIVTNCYKGLWGGDGTGRKEIDTIRSILTLEKISWACLRGQKLVLGANKWAKAFSEGISTWHEQIAAIVSLLSKCWIASIIPHHLAA